MATDRQRTAGSPRRAGAARLSEGLRTWISVGLPAPSGAFYAWVEAESGEPSFEYPEITGYALSHLAGQSHLTSTEAEAGNRAGQWLVARLGAGDLSARTGWDGHAVYRFDLAMIASGLLSFGDRFDVQGFRTAGSDLARSLAAQVGANGSLEAVAQVSGRCSSRCAWSTQGEAHLLKVVQALLQAGRREVPGCAEAARRLVDHVTCLQEPDGRFVTQPGDEMVMLHPHLYAVEGLWMYGAATADAAVMERARLGAGWAWHHQLASGGFPRLVRHGQDDEPGTEQTDVTAQALRAALVTGLSPDGLERAVGRLGDIAVDYGDQGLALPYQPEADVVHANAAATLFGAQAVSLAVGGAPMIHWSDLV